MSERAALVAAVAAAPDDDLPRLVFADWLEENGEPERAEFVRLSVAYYREATAFPPAPDPAKRARIHELFRTHHAAWLRPVYESLGLPIPSLGSANGIIAEHDRWQVSSLGGVSVSHEFDRAVRSVVLHAGTVGMVVCSPARLPDTASLTRAMTVEPLEVLNLTLPAGTGVWERFAGPHLDRVRALTPTFEGAGDFRPLAEALCGGEHLHGLRGLTVTPELGGTGSSPTAVLYDTLRTAPLRRQLTRLTLYDLPGMGQLLSRSDHGFDSLRELAVSTRGWPGGADALFADDISNWYRERLTRLQIETSERHGLGWLTAGEPWVQLGVLHLSGTGVRDLGAMALAGANTLAALRELRLYRQNITDTGGIALARSPLVGRLQALFLDGNQISDTGAKELAAALDRGLGYLSLRQLPAPLSAAVRKVLSDRYGPRIALT